MPSATATSEPGTPGAERLSPTMTASDAMPRSRVTACVLAEVGDDVPGLLEEVAFALGDAEHLGELADDDCQREADDEPPSGRAR